MRALLVAILLVTACTAETSKNCRRVCARQGECESVVAATAEGSGTDTAFDEGECVAACAALERDPSTVGLVKSHVECIEKAGAGSGACPAILECR